MFSIGTALRGRMDGYSCARIISLMHGMGNHHGLAMPPPREGGWGKNKQAVGIQRPDYPSPFMSQFQGTHTHQVCFCILLD